MLKKLLPLTLLFASTTLAADFTVMNNSDAGVGSLRQAIFDAEGNAEADTITFAPALDGQTITLTSGELVFGSDITITGLGMENLILSGGGTQRIFRITGGNVLLSDLTITGGSSTFGGAMNIVNATVELDSVKMEANTVVPTGFASAEGGAIAATASNLTINFSQFLNNSVSGDPAFGGAISYQGTDIDSGHSVIIENSIFTGNSVLGSSGTDARGGALYLSNITNIAISESSFTLNRSEQTAGVGASGGAVYYNGVRNDSISDSNFSNNTAKGSGGYGGALVTAGSITSIISNTIFRGNVLESSAHQAFGGAFTCLTGNCVLKDCLVENNSLTSGNTGVGGGVASFFGNLTIENSSIVNNSLTTTGGQALGGGAGGAILRIVVSNSTIAQNTISAPLGFNARGAGVHFATTISNSTIVDNSFLSGDQQEGGGVYQGGAVVSSIIAGNSATSGPDIFGTGIVSNSLIQSSDGHTLTDGVDGNIVGSDPMLSALITSGDSRFYLPLAGSSVIDKGSNPSSLTLDQRGAGFVREFGLQADMGAIEVQDAAEIEIRGLSQEISSGDTTPSLADNTDFSEVGVGDTKSVTYSVLNSGALSLTLNGTPQVSVSGSASFSVSTFPSATVAANGGSTAFVIDYSPTALGVESAVVSIDSNDIDEATYTFTIQAEGIDSTDTDNDGIPDFLDDDDDNDGVSDVQEIADGTNSLDAGSNVPVLSTSFCSEWNGFLGLLNVNEYSSSASTDKAFTVTLFDSVGVAQSSTGGSVLANSQADVLIHDLLGFSADQYGRTCTDVASAAPGEIYGRTTFYHLDSSGAAFDFVFSAPFGDGLIGAQFVPFNTFDPSELQENFVANWISVINSDSSPQPGTMFYYAQDGSILGSETVSIAADGRRDFAAHQFGSNIVGLAEWRPDVATARAVVRNVRYYYDNDAGAAPSFNSAMPVDALKPTGEEVFVALDKSEGTAVLELSNASSDTIEVAITLRSLNGSLEGSLEISLAAHQTTHVVTDDIVASAIGSATLKSNAISSLVAVATHYGRDDVGVLKNAYSTRARQTKGAVLRGSYNTFLGQDCDLVMVNSTDSIANLSINMTRFDGVEVVSGESVSIPARGTTNYSLCQNDTANHYGSVVITPSAADSVTGSIIRNGADSERYRFLTELRP